ncbi:MAG TPA: hypothetical protein VIW25_01215 [Nitrososphaeraceae archaeon]|jgi:hypothetical protein
MVDGKTNLNSGAAAKAKELAIVFGRKIANAGKKTGYTLGHILKRSATSAGVKTKSIGNQKGGVSEPLVKNLPLGRNNKAKQGAGAKSRLSLKKLATNLSVQSKKTIEETKRGIKADMKVTKDSNMANSSEENPEIVIKRVNLNESVAQSIERIGIDCEAIEVNSLAIENRPYYSYKLPMTPKIVTNRGCIKVNGKSFGLIQIIQRN